MSCDPSLVGTTASASECQQVWDGRLQMFLDSQCGLAPWQGLTFYSLGQCQPFLPLKGSQHSSGLPSDVYQAQRNKYCLVVWVSESRSQDLFPDTQTLLQRHCANCFWKASPLPVFSLSISSFPFLLLPLSPSAPRTCPWRRPSTADGKMVGNWFLAVHRGYKASADMNYNWSFISADSKDQKRWHKDPVTFVSWSQRMSYRLQGNVFESSHCSE